MNARCIPYLEPHQNNKVNTWSINFHDYQSVTSAERTLFVFHSYATPLDPCASHPYADYNTVPKGDP